MPRLGRKVAVLETCYPWMVPGGPGEEPARPARRAAAGGGASPPTPVGQAAYFRELRTTIENVRDGGSFGFVAWELEWLPKPGWQQDMDNRWANQTMLDWTGAALPSLDVFRA